MLFTVLLEDTSAPDGERKRVERAFAAIRPTELVTRTGTFKARRTYKVQWSDIPLILMPVEKITRCVQGVPIIGPYKWNQPFTPPMTDQEVWDMYDNALGFIVNNRIDCETFNCYW
ncbi:hypothetical protein BJ508DRAFT_335162 [Ascobolus immersus RN42]|uniref:Uncharacterized protein n=1 Tax=Ascobolus immersus RN42 TaxID=1160509 RepID=A0A3N4HDJ5_ASCIM|nr:hypothetical protein BJ508DRAFT_335162 [Ascobolus immersus RN42]